MTIDQKAQRYDEVIEIARKEYEKHKSFKGFCEMLAHIFPELKENEDEKIRNEIILYVGARDDISLNTHNRWLAWLEKQGEQEEPQVYETKDGEVITYSESDGYKVVEPHFEKPIDKVKQKLAWSDEDEKRLKSCLNILQPKTLVGNVETINTKWLKSLKERYAWKPSEEQMKALEHFVRSIGESGYASPYDNDTKLIYSLYEQLKQL